MKKWKRFLSLTIAAVMALSLLSLQSFAVGATDPSIELDVHALTSAEMTAYGVTDSGVYGLFVTGDPGTDAAGTALSTTLLSAVISYDNTVIVPYDYSASPASLSADCFVVTGKYKTTGVAASQLYTPMPFDSATSVSTSGSTTTFEYGVYTADTVTVTGPQVMYVMLFKLASSKTLYQGALRVATGDEMAAVSASASVSCGNGTDHQYTAGASDNSMSTPEYTWVSGTPQKLASMTVDTIAALTVPSGSTAATSALTLGGTDVLGNAMASAPAVTWSIVSPTAHPGISVVANGSGGYQLQVTKDAAGNTFNSSNQMTVTVQATESSPLNGADPVTTTGTATITRSAAAAASVTIAGSAAQTVPVQKADHTDDTTTNSLTASVLDQYGAAMTGAAIDWTISSPASHTGISITNGGVLTVASAASALFSSGSNSLTVTVQAQTGTKTATKDITLSRSTPAPNYLKLAKTTGTGTVPTAAAGNQTVTLPDYTCYDQYGVAASASCTWTGPASDSISGTSVTITPAAAAGTHTFVLTCDSNSALTATYVLTLSKSAAVLTSFDVTAQALTVPTATEAQKTYTLSIANPKDQYGAAYAVTGDVTWSMSGSYQGMSISGNTLTVTPAASQNTFNANSLQVTLSAAVGGVTKTQAFTLTRAADAISTVRIYTDSGCTAALASSANVAIPATGSRDTTYYAKAYNQYGYGMTGTPVWSVTGDNAAADKITVNATTGVLTVYSTATPDKTVALQATVSGVSATATLTAKTIVIPFDANVTTSAITYGAPLASAVTLPSGTINATTVDGEVAGTFRLKAETGTTIPDAGIATATVVFTITGSGAYAGTYEKDYSITVNPRPVSLSWSGDTGLVFDGSGKAPAATITNLVGKDSPSLSYSYAGTLADAASTPYAASSSKPINAGSYQARVTMLSNANYTLTNATGTTDSFEISPAIATINAGDLAVTRAYNGTLTGACTVTGHLNYTERRAEDDVTVGFESSTFTDANAGTGKTVLLSNISLSGSGAYNYTPNTTSFTFVNGTITPQTIIVSGITAENKDYDGNNTAVLDFSAAVLGGKISGDSLGVTATGQFTAAAAGTTTVQLSGLTLTGASAANYSINASGSQTTASARISQKALTVLDGSVKVTKEYDGNKTAGTLTGTLGLSGVVSGETVGIQMSAVSVGDYPDATYGTYPVELSGIALEGATSANYTVPGTYQFGSATITKTVPTSALLDVTLPDHPTYSNTAATVTAQAKTGITGLGVITVYYTGTAGTTYAKTTEAPVNAGTYAVTISIAAGDNYAAAEIDGGTFAIAKAARVLTASIDASILTLGHLSGTITASTSTNLDNSATYQYTSSNSSVAAVTTTGTVTAQGNGDVTITVSIPETTNYLAAQKTISVTAVAAPATGVSATCSGPQDYLWAKLNGTTIELTGSVTSGQSFQVSLTTANHVAGTNSLSIPVNSAEDLQATNHKIALTVGTGGTNDVSVTYSVDSSKVQFVDSTYKLEPADTIAQAADTISISIRNEIQVALTNVQTQAQHLENAMADMLLQRLHDVQATHQEQIESFRNQIHGDVTLVAKAGLDITANSYTPNQTFNMTITPVSTLFASGEKADGTPLTQQLGESNVALTTAPAEPLQVNVVMPSDCIWTASTPVFAKIGNIIQRAGVNILTPDGMTLQGTGNEVVVSFKTQTFGNVELFTDNRSATIQYQNEDGTSYQTQTYYISDAGSALPSLTKSGYTFNGWTINGTTYSTLSEGLLANGGQTLTATPSFTMNSTSGGGGTVSYKITVTAGENGTITPASCSVNKGESKTFTVTPGTGYRIADVQVDGKSVGAVSTYTFKSVSSSHTISATFQKGTDVSDIFTDIHTDTWCHDAVQYVYDNGYMKGVSESTFAPARTLNRGMWVTMLYRLAGSPAVTGAENFSDVDSTTWCYNAIVWATNNQIINGFKDGTFRPDANVTRQQLVAILYRYARFSGYDVSASASLSGFTDANQVWATEALQWALAKDILSGTSTTMLSPNGNANRGQAATFLMRFAKIYHQ